MQRDYPKNQQEDALFPYADLLARERKFGTLAEGESSNSSFIWRNTTILSDFLDFFTCCFTVLDQIEATSEEKKVAL